MNVSLRKWEKEDGDNLSKLLSNKKILDNLRDGLPYPYTKEDALEYINFILESDPDSTFAYAIDVDGWLLEVLVLLDRKIFIHALQSLDITWMKHTGQKEL